MKRVIAIGLTCLMLGACANAVETGPSFLGFGSAIADDADDQSEVAPSRATHRVKSNKVLAAMAFQRATGRPVDPSRLSGE